MSDITFVTTKEMMEEFKGRFDSFVFHGTVKKDTIVDTYHFDWQGGVAACLGLLEYGKWKRKDDVKNIKAGQ